MVPELDRRGRGDRVVVVALVRLWISRGRDEFSLWPDEPAQLAMSRFIGGGVPWNMHDHSTWQPGYATLISPVHWFTDDPVTVLHVALAVNAVLGGIAAFLLVLIVRQLTHPRTLGRGGDRGHRRARPCSAFHDRVHVVGVARGRPVPGDAAGPAAVRGLRRRSGAACSAGIGAALAFGTHSRMLPLACVTIGARRG